MFIFLVSQWRRLDLRKGLCSSNTLISAPIPCTTPYWPPSEPEEPLIPEKPHVEQAALPRAAPSTRLPRAWSFPVMCFSLTMWDARLARCCGIRSVGRGQAALATRDMREEDITAMGGDAPRKRRRSAAPKSVRPLLGGEAHCRYQNRMRHPRPHRGG